jgi:hypothetical protein
MPLQRLLAQLREHTRPRVRFALLGLVGMLMVATPLTEVLRQHARNLDLLIAARAVLDPLADTAAVQRALIAHERTAAAALAGSAAAVPLRAVHEAEVDQRLATLTATLDRGRYAAAGDECAQLRSDWTVLADGLQRRRLSTQASTQAHELLLDQTVQIGDLLVLEGRLHAAATLAGSAVPRPAADARRARTVVPAAELAALGLRLGRAEAELRRHRAGFVALLALLGMLAAVLAASLQRPTRGPPAPPGGGSDSGPESRAPTEALMQRLRGTEQRDDHTPSRAGQL